MARAFRAICHFTVEFVEAPCRQRRLSRNRFGVSIDSQYGMNRLARRFFGAEGGTINRRMAWRIPATGRCKAPIYIRQSWLYTSSMTQSWRRKGLAELADTDRAAKIACPEGESQARKAPVRSVGTHGAVTRCHRCGKDARGATTARILYSSAAGRAATLQRANEWAACLTFAWKSENAVDVDLENYH